MEVTQFGDRLCHADETSKFKLRRTANLAKLSNTDEEFPRTQLYNS